MTCYFDTAPDQKSSPNGAPKLIVIFHTNSTCDKAGKRIACGNPLDGTEISFGLLSESKSIVGEGMTQAKVIALLSHPGLRLVTTGYNFGKEARFVNVDPDGQVTGYSVIEKNGKDEVIDSQHPRQDLGELLKTIDALRE